MRQTDSIRREVGGYSFVVFTPTVKPTERGPSTQDAGLARLGDCRMLAGVHGNRTHQRPVSRPLDGFEDRGRHQPNTHSLGLGPLRSINSGLGRTGTQGLVREY